MTTPLDSTVAADLETVSREELEAAEAVLERAILERAAKRGKLWVVVFTDRHRDDELTVCMDREVARRYAVALAKRFAQQRGHSARTWREFWQDRCDEEEPCFNAMDGDYYIDILPAGVAK